MPDKNTPFIYNFLYTKLYLSTALCFPKQHLGHKIQLRKSHYLTI